jgi:hypothetical protein
MLEIHALFALLSSQMRICPSSSSEFVASVIDQEDAQLEAIPEPCAPDAAAWVVNLCRHVFDIPPGSG